MTETDLQKSVVQWLDLVKPDAYWFHVPNESKAHINHRRKLKAMGVKAGVADLVFVMPGGRVGFIELKHGKGRQSDSQKGFANAMAVLGAPYQLARSIGEVEGILKAWGALKQKAATRDRPNRPTSLHAPYMAGKGVSR